MPKFTVTFQVESADRQDIALALRVLENELKDSLNVAVLPVLDLELVPLSFTIRKSRR